LAQATHALTEIARLAPEFGEALTLLGEAQVQVKEASLELRRLLEKLEADPRRLEWLDQKLGDIHRLARKHQVNPRELRQHLDGLRRELDGIEHGSETIARLQAELEKLAADYFEAAAQLSARRAEGARQLQERISATIRELGMPQGQFLIEVDTRPDQDPSPFGHDQVEFLVSTNPGLPPRPLSKVASGGELSRISLGLQVAATDSKTTPTLIFDEVDTGIGGGVAEIVGQKLRALGEARQVFCVTHLHQVAAQGHHHLLVEKSTVGGNTQTRVRKLSGSDRKHEIARMLGGVRITEQTLAHAEEMLNSQSQGAD
jgi:DNA repair protein RecN (Recombination protein N)